MLDNKLDISGTSLGILSLGLFLLIMLASASIFKPQIDSTTFRIKEGELNKSKELQLKGGESYYYTYKVGNESANLTFAVINGQNCTMLFLVESQEGVCLDSYGNDRTGLNSSFNTTGMIIFKPWMLAIDEGWAWNVSTYTTIDTYEKLFETTDFSFVRREQYKGRDAYVVRMSGSEGDYVWQWIDAEKRILLREIGPTYEVELVKGVG